MKVPYGYLDKQFKNPDPVLKEIKKIAKKGEFTLGPKVEEFEKKIAKFQGTKYAVGVNSGTAGLFLILKALGIGSGDEVITVPNSFLATAAVIDLAGAKIVFVDINGEYNMDPTKIEAAITKKTKAILPVHWTGNPADMPAILKIAKKHKLYTVEDSAQAIDASIDGKRTGSFGTAAEFSLHPIKNFNVWGDGGFITTDDSTLADKLKLLRNHGLRGRDTCEFWGFNERLHSLQATVALTLMPTIKSITDRRIKVARKYDSLLSDIPQITIPARRKNVRQVYHVYILQAENRDNLVKYLIENSIEAKIHYPVPLHLQPAAKKLGYKKGNFPVTENQAEHIFSLPNNEYLTDSQLEYVSGKIHKFYHIN